MDFGMDKTQSVTGFLQKTPDLQCYIQPYIPKGKTQVLTNDRITSIQPNALDRLITQ